MLKSWPYNKSLVTSAMFRNSPKCFPAKHGKLDGFWVVPTSFFANFLRLHTVQNWITHHPNPKSAMWHLLWRITGRIGLQWSSHWAHEVDPLIATDFKIWCFWRSWAMVSDLELLWSWRRSLKKCLVHLLSDLYIIHQSYTIEHTIPSQTSVLLWPQFWPLQPWNPAVQGYGKKGKTNLPSFGQINWIEFQPGLAETTTLITLLIKISHHPNTRLLVGWRHYFNRSHQIAFSVPLEPKWPFWTAAILDCIIGIDGNHAMILETKRVFTEVLSGTFIFKRNIHTSMSSSLPHHSVLPGVKRWKAAGLSNAKPRGITVSLVTFQVFS